MDDATERVAAGYDAVYAAIRHSPTFQRIWRTHAMRSDFPDGFEHISFLTLGEMRDLAAELALSAGDVLLDLACGMGGPGLWVSRETGAALVGIDASGVAVTGAVERAARVGAADARFAVGRFDATGLDGECADAAMSVDALQYAPDKLAAFREFARVLRPGGRLAFVCFEFEPERVAGVPVLGADPVDDYRPGLEAAGFDVMTYEETAGWRERVTAAYQAVVDARDVLTPEMGEGATNALMGEMMLTLQVQPYRRRVFVSARRR